MKDNILIINYYYPPIVNGGIQRTLNFKKYLTQMGYSVSFVTTSSFGCLCDDSDNLIYRFPDKGYDYTQNDKNSKLGILFFRAFRLMQVKCGLISDGKYYWKREVIKNLDALMKEKKYDLVIASYPTPANLELGRLIHRKYGIPLIVDYRDGLMYEPFYEIQRNFLLSHRLLSLERQMAKETTLHLTVNYEMNKYYSTQYPNVKAVMIPNGFDDEEVFDQLPVSLPEGVNVVYTGSIGKSRKIYENEDLSHLLDYIFNIRQDINYVFVGDYLTEEKQIFAKYKNVYLYDKTDRKTVIATQRVADALLLISGPKGNTSGKLYEYLFSGKPILNIGGHTGISSIVDDDFFGTTCEPNETAKIELFINNLVEGKLCYKRKDLKQYTRRYQTAILAREIDQIIAEKNNN